jgi:hypothetical protein
VPITSQIALSHLTAQAKMTHSIVLLLIGISVSLASPAVELPDLPYGYSALSPVISKKTLMTHHLKHHAKWVQLLHVYSLGSRCWWYLLYLYSLTALVLDYCMCIHWWLSSISGFRAIATVFSDADDGSFRRSTRSTLQVWKEDSRDMRYRISAYAMLLVHVML